MTQSTEEYWGRAIAITTEKQENGSWSATATVRGSGADGAAPYHVQNQPSAEQAAAAARSQATAGIDAERVSHGKP